MHSSVILLNKEAKWWQTFYLNISVPFINRCSTEQNCDELLISSSSNFLQNRRVFSGSTNWHDFEMPGWLVSISTTLYLFKKRLFEYFESPWVDPKHLTQIIYSRLLKRFRFFFLGSGRLHNCPLFYVFKMFDLLKTVLKIGSMLVLPSFFLCNWMFASQFFTFFFFTLHVRSFLYLWLLDPIISCPARCRFKGRHGRNKLVWKEITLSLFILLVGLLSISDTSAIIFRFQGSAYRDGVVTRFSFLISELKSLFGIRL